MYKLSESGGWWKGLSTSHDERIMTASARQSKSKMQSNGKCNAKFCELAGSNAGDNFQSLPRVRDDDRESRRLFFQDQGCVGTLNFLSFLWILPRFGSRALH